jgi:rhomboid protease GluP
LSSSPPPPPLRPIYEAPPDEHRLVPPGWLDQSPVTRMLLALNVCVYLAGAFVSGQLSNLPLRAALALGASYPLATVGEGRYETLITACFLHAGVVHLAFNMLALWQAGPLVERAVGSARMAPMYLVAGAFGNLVSVLHGWLGGRPDVSFTVGASGAISGCIGAALVLAWRTTGWRGPLTQAMLRWLGILVAFGVFSNLGGGSIDNAAHIGGAAAGAAIACLWKRRRRYSPRATAAVLIACAGVVAGSVGVLVVRNRTDPFAVMDLPERVEFTGQAVQEGHCGDALQGLRAVEREGARTHAADSLREAFVMPCGHPPD